MSSASEKRPTKPAKRVPKSATGKSTPKPRKRAPAARTAPKPPPNTARPQPTITPAQRRALTTLRRLSAAGGAPGGITPLDDLLALLVRVCGQIPAATAPADVFALALDDTTPAYLFAQSTNDDMRRWHGTERELMLEATAKTHTTTSAFLREAVLIHARRILSTYAAPAVPTGIARRGHLGVNDAAFDAAYATLKKHGRPVTASLLCAEAKLPGRLRGAIAWAQRRNVTFDPDARKTRAAPTTAATAGAAPIAIAPAPNTNPRASARSADEPHADTVEGVIYENDTDQPARNERHPSTGRDEHHA